MNEGIFKGEFVNNKISKGILTQIDGGELKIKI